MTATSTKIGVGSTIWVFDQNHRIYPKDSKGHSTGSPIYREYWRPQQIVSETRVSWITSWRKKVPKRGAWGVAFTEQQVDDACWVNDHKYEVIRKLETAGNGNSVAEYAKLLREVAKLVGYDETKSA